ncbi:hypothetical protein D0817_19285 [Flavobacterium cupreum]|uniref:Uncharacterized protein n=2 Tax=Flavobacterium TaxID=237 RepID=A0A4Y7U9K5_9FLAO|nr:MULTISPECIES: hypothetical protein [Flavobacterium]RUT68761.1 hypothetical protein D0817_19285 [Flavobacterium cupreum]TCN55502.1 hypothetical protein EV142_106191 [Flavobacterium circumlabens]TEB43090.1 hypothetical protein D0809_16785 [Flavobacterium circumlabens]
MALKRSSLENYVLLMLYVDSMSFTKFKPKTFLKKIRPFCKTEHLGFKILHIRIRGSNLGISIDIQKDCFVVRQNHALHEFIFYCDSCKVLLKKLLKHNLLIP